MVEEIKIEDGVKWIYDHRKRPKNAIGSQKLAPVIYTATYECERCGHTWNTVEQYRSPVNSIPCLITSCSKPSIFSVIYRQLKGEPIQGCGKLKTVEVRDWID